MTYQTALQALADPTRREILERLRGGPLPVGAVAQGLPVSRPAVSQHLRVLKEAGLVSEQREGTKRLYGVSARGLVELNRDALVVKVEGLATGEYQVFLDDGMGTLAAIGALSVSPEDGDDDEEEMDEGDREHEPGEADDHEGEGASGDGEGRAIR